MWCIIMIQDDDHLVSGVREAMYVYIEESINKLVKRSSVGMNSIVNISPD